MTIQTTTIGAYPKPDCVPIPDWFQEESTTTKDPTKAYDNCSTCQGPEADELLELFKNRVIILGVIGIPRSRIETTEEIAFRLRNAIEHIDRERLMAAPDCGLGMLSRRQVESKLKNMVKAANMI